MAMWLYQMSKEKELSEDGYKWTPAKYRKEVWEGHYLKWETRKIRPIEMIGQAFADEVFRVFAREHPEIHLTPLHANAEVMKMISRAKNSGN